MVRTPDNLIAGYVPVVDNGYLRALKPRVEEGYEVGIFDTQLVREFAPYARKEIRAIEPETIQPMLQSLGMHATIFSRQMILDTLASPGSNVTMFDDDISQGLLEIADPLRANVSMLTHFLRWNRSNTAVDQPVNPDHMVESAELDELFGRLYGEAAKSSDWWRHVAAAIIDQAGNIQSIEHNTGMPHEYTVAMEGDPRILSQRGSDIELSLFIHAEANCIADSARRGITLEGSKIYVTTFPCPNCAKMIAASGIKEVYFTEGYAMLDGQRVLEANGVKIIQVQTQTTLDTPPERLIPYPEK